MSMAFLREGYGEGTQGKGRETSFLTEEGLKNSNSSFGILLTEFSENGVQKTFICIHRRKPLMDLPPTTKPSVLRGAMEVSGTPSRCT